MKSKITVFVVLLLVMTTVSAFAAGGQEGPVFINVASGGTGGTYYPLAGAMANIWQDNIQNVNVSAQSTGASVANVNLLKEGNADVIFVQNDIAFYAMNGQEMFKDNAFKDMAGFATLYPETIQVIALVESGIMTVADLKGKRVAVGAAGSGTEANARQIMAAAGLTYADVTVQYLNFNEAASNLKDGNVDAAFVTAGHPTAAVQDVAATKNIRIVKIDAAMAAKLNAQYPFYTKTTVPAGTYRGVDAAVETVAVKAMLVVSNKLSANLVEQMAKALFANNDRLTAAHRMGALVTIPNAQDGMSLPLHPGAEKFYKSAK
ncbi:MAG: C4-dicarboxylate ABC transporter substrate-binding protein [Spirochaetes bacterium RIFOXYC1_FULL_54_7]|nr:MAG: C4-dicarboxylate ABC transporter substrate-binding protein [Spirochaetes bacterium RIFOXYC1_FULL_54_7]